MPKDGPHPTDKHVGGRVRMRRMMLGRSQTQLGEALGITFQQVQKYEKGANRISASRLQHISEILQVEPIGFGVMAIAVVLPCGDFLDECLLVGYAAVEPAARKWRLRP
jgi:transcriptional regulator with XRE-family HTH domain